jgi:hypothetical protein
MLSVTRPHPLQVLLRYLPGAPQIPAAGAGDERMADPIVSAALVTLQQELEEALVRRRQVAHLQELLAANRADAEQRAPVVRELRERLDRERSDVERLEGLSFTAILWTIAGRKGERLEQEREELAAARLMYEAEAADAEAREFERTRLSQELSALGDVESRCAALMAQKEHLLLQSEDDQGKRLLEVVERLARLRSEVKELQEAHAAGKAARAAVGEVRQALETAAGWGSWDLWGGGLLASSIKHDHLDDAQQHAVTANAKIEAFRRELRDTGLAVEIVGTAEVNESDRFYDLFVDNFFTDWTVQTRINEASDAAGQALIQLTVATEAVDTRLEKARAELAAAQQSRTKLLEGGSG